MNLSKITFLASMLLLSAQLFAQSPVAAKVHVTGKVVEKTTQQPLEYSTVTIFNVGSKTPISGGITNAKGEFDVEVNAGTYDISIEFISFQVVDLKNRTVSSNLNLGTISLQDDVTQLSEVVIRNETTAVDIKLDKKVYSIGNDLMVKGGTVSDVLDNIPSVTVDSDGSISLRGNESVRILIDGRPSTAINVAEALKMLPADAIDKVEVITNPSARYDSEGGAGILNIILKKGKRDGFNGTVIGTVGDPENYGLSANLNFRDTEFNLFTSTGYNYRTSNGNSRTETQYLNPDGSVRNYITDRRTNERLNKGFNSTVGLEWFLADKTIWTNSINIRKSKGENPDDVYYDNYDAAKNYQFTTARFNDANNKDYNLEYATNFEKKFPKEGHIFTIDGSFSKEGSKDNSDINFASETTFNDQTESRNTIKADYVLPFGKNSQFEAGYKGDFNNLYTIYEVDTLDISNNTYISDERYSNTLEYKENINALYTQFGTKFNKFSVLLGLRYEATKVNINQITSQDYNTKSYQDFFPSAFLTYEISDKSSTSLSYSRRVSRPRGRMINPFSNYSSNINLFKGNPDLNASYTDAIDLGYLKRWDKVTFNTSLYVNKTTQSVQFIRTESGDFVSTDSQGSGILTPVIITTPINLATSYRYGFEFSLNYTPYKWWKLNSNFNIYGYDTKGDYTYTDFNDQEVTQNFDNNAVSWFARLSSKVTLPYKIDWQTNLNYYGPSSTAQGKSYGIGVASLAFSKDFFKEQATVSLNVNDVFNSRIRKYDTNILNVLNSESEMQWRTRTVLLSVTYRFNQKKTERQKVRQPSNEGGGEEFPG
ncbi:MAG: TonB-dependent receptor domain-containing protein [Flavobacterium sp.]